MNNKYVAIKVKGISHYFWFKKENVTISGGTFKGNEGWGKGGALTNITTPESEIISRIESNELQYRS